jgi:uncharacterized protein YidB (DUF937 family)
VPKHSRRTCRWFLDSTFAAATVAGIIHRSTPMSLLNNVLMGPQTAGLFGRGRGLGGGGVSPLTLALLGTLAYRTMKGKGRLADVLGTNRPQQPGGQGAALGGGMAGGLGGGIGGDLLSPAALSEGLSRLLNRFRANGHGEAAESWIQKGSNKPIAPPALAEALGEERIAWLMEQTGMTRAELLEGLSKTLPDAVDKLTPDGRIPDAEEAQRLM